MKFLSESLNNKVLGDIFNGFVIFEDFLVEKVYGEFHTLIKTSLQKKYPFFEDINGGEGIVWKLIAKEVGEVLFIDEVSILYDDSGDDRLSIKNYKRLCPIFKKDIKILGDKYFKVDKIYFFKAYLKKVYYCIRKSLS
mgnify:CR=1 FL=1